MTSTREAPKPGPVRTFSELARASNLPTAWSNAFAGLALSGAGLSVQAAALPVAAVSCLYIAGMVLNDAADADHDAEARPGRPIPSGRVSRTFALWIGLAAAAAGIGLAFAASVASGCWSLGLVGSIVLYTLLHKRTAWATVFMGACRALIYPLTAAAVTVDVGSTAIVACAVAVGLYTVALTLAARREDTAGARLRWRSTWLVPLPLAVPLVFAPWDQLAPTTLAASVLLIAWLIGAFSLASRAAAQGRVVHTVMGYLAAFCLADALWIAVFVAPAAAAIPLVCYVITRFAHRAVLGS